MAEIIHALFSLVERSLGQGGDPLEDGDGEVEVEFGDLVSAGCVEGEAFVEGAKDYIDHQDDEGTATCGIL
jgi:hypothetical protein